MREQLGVESGKMHELCRGIHAKQNAIIQAAYHGVSVNGAVIYCTNQPCSICARMIINAGIKKIYYQAGYADSLAKELLGEAGIEIIQINSDNRGEGS